MKMLLNVASAGEYRPQTDRHKVHLMRLPDLRPLIELPAEVKHRKQWNVDVRNQEVGRIEAEENGEAVDENEQSCPEHAPH